MSRPTALLVMGGDPIHDTPEHYELLAGLLAGPAGLNLHITDELEPLTRLAGSDYDLIAMYRADRQPTAAPFATLWDAVRAGTPYLGLHGAAFTVEQVSGGAEAVGARYEEPASPAAALDRADIGQWAPDYCWRGVLYGRGRTVPPDAARAGRAARAGVVLRLCAQPPDAPWCDCRAG